MADEKKVITLDDFEQRLMVSGLMDFRNDLLKEEKPTEDINDLILKVIDAPTKKEKRKATFAINLKLIKLPAGERGAVLFHSLTSID